MTKIRKFYFAGKIFSNACINCLILTTLVFSLPIPNQGDSSNGHLSLPNRDVGKERIFGLGFVLPYPYFQKPKYRYPVYDRNGRGTLLYGYGGKETYNYRVFTPIEGHHK